MATAELPKLMTVEEFLTLPEDGFRRELIHGELREDTMTYRNLRHTQLAATFSKVLGIWLETQPHPKGMVLVGDAGFLLTKEPDTIVGTDVAYISPELAAAAPEDARTIDGIPVLAVEILSPSDTQKNITDKIKAYLDAKVPLVWIVEPVFRTVTVYRPDAKPQLVNEEQQLTGDPHLPGFSVALSELF